MSKIKQYWGQKLVKWGHSLYKPEETAIKPEIVPLPKIPISLIDFNSLDYAEREYIMPLVHKALKAKLDQVINQEQAIFAYMQRNIKEYPRLAKEEAELHRRRVQWRAELIWFSNRFWVMAISSIILLGVGIVGGINLPNAIACDHEQTPCWQLRLRQGKIIVK